jgi:dephospho-CoA kinase
LSGSADAMPAVPRIALTGGIGSGKSTLARMLEARGAGLVDADAVAHRITAAGGAAIGPIRERFGAAFIDENGALDRARMRAHVFGDERQRQALEALLHPLIREQCELRAAELAGTVPYLLFDITLLAEAPGSERRFDRVLVIDCPAEVQVARVLERGSMTREQIEAVLAAQASRERRLAIADDVLFNDAGLDQLERGASRLHERYRALRGAPATV